jgi:aminocyclitol acetyltransferase
MEYRIPTILRDCAKGREVVLWGTDFDSQQRSPLVRRHADPAFYVSRDLPADAQFLGKPVRSKDALTPDKHYVILLSADWQAGMELGQLGFKKFDDYYDWSEIILPFDVDYMGVTVGKGTFHSLPALGMFFLTGIGRFCSINDSAMIHHDHPTSSIATGRFYGIMDPDDLRKFSERAVSNMKNPAEKLKIGNDVWIGANAFINASRCHEIGDGAIIGAGAIVMDDVPPYAIVAGAPAKVKKFRFTPEQIEILQRVRWWEWDNAKIRENAELIIYPDKFFERFAAEA